MKKSNIKGFILAEVIVVSVVVISAIIILYMQFTSVNNSYYRSFKYNTIDDLYSVNNIRSFIEVDNLDNIIEQLNEKNYVDLSSCSNTYFIEYNYCKNLLSTLNVKTLIFTYEDVTNLKKELNTPTFSEGMKTFIKTISSTKNNKYRIIVEFEDDRYATLKLGSFIASNISNDCVNEGNTCTINQIKEQVSLTLAVNDNETYNFNVLSDNGETLTLIMNDNFEDDIYWNNTAVASGPTNILDYIKAKTSNWDNVLDITYTLNGTDSTNFTGCESITNCTSNVYQMDTINSKARLPMLQELINLGCTSTAGSCSTWLNLGLSSGGTTGFWTSSATSSNVWIISYDNRLNTTTVNSENIRIKPVITINKSAL